MSLIVKECSECGGFCCRAITLNIGKRNLVPKSFQRISGLEALGRNPFLPLQKLIEISSTPVEFYTCTNLNKTGLCKIHNDRFKMCSHYPSDRDEDLLNFIFVVPWCAYREKQLILQGQDYEFGTLEECMRYYTDPTINSLQQFGVCLDDCIRFVNYFLESDVFHNNPRIFSSEVEDLYLREFFEVYRVHFLVAYHRMTVKLKNMRHIFNKAAMLAYDHGVSPIDFWNMVNLYAKTISCNFKVPFPTFCIGDDFKDFLISRLVKIEARESKKYQKKI